MGPGYNEGGNAEESMNFSYGRGENKRTPLWVMVAGVVGFLLVVVGCIALIRGNSEEAPAAGYPVAPWPMFRYDARHTGLSPFIGPEKPQVLWSKTIKTSYVSDPLVAADGTVYVAAGGKLHAFKPDGSEAGTLSLPAGIVSAAIVSDNTFYVVTGNNKLCAVKKDGRVLWTYSAAGDVTYSPIVGNAGVAYIVSQIARNQVVLEAVNPFGIKMWSFQVESQQPVTLTQPAIDELGNVVICSSSGTVYFIKPDGVGSWTYQTGSEISTAPMMGREGTIYVSSGGRIYALNPEGFEEWVQELDEAAAQAMGIDNTIYVSTGSSGRLAAVGPNGDIVWKIRLRDVLCTNPVVGGGEAIYIGSENGKVYAVTDTGKKKWEIDLANSPIISTPVIGGKGVIYVWSYNTLWAIGNAS